jgi:hypothetical protein
MPCGFGRPYADVARIGSAKARHAGRGKSAQGATKNRRYSLRGKNTLAMAAEKAHAALRAASSPVFFCERQARMTIRSRREVITFKHPFRIRCIDRLLPAGAYEVVTDEETIEGLSFEAFRRVATTIKVPREGSRGLAIEVVSIGSVDLANAQRIDASTFDV